MDSTNTLSRGRAALKRARRRGAVNKGLLAILGMAIVAAGVYWYVHLKSSRTQADPIAPNALVSMYCTNCQAPMSITAKEFDALPMQSGRRQCPKCKQFTASRGLPTEGVGGVAVP